MRALAVEWANKARSGTERSAAYYTERLVQAMNGGDRRLAEFCMELMADLPVATLFAVGIQQIVSIEQNRRWALAQTLALAFQKKPLVETTELAERCLLQALALVGSARRIKTYKGRTRETAAAFVAQAIVWLETMNGSAVWQQPTEPMKLSAQKIATAAQKLPLNDQDNLRTVLLRLIGALPELWAEELMIDALNRSQWTAFAAIEALRAHSGARIDAALWSALQRPETKTTPILAKAVYAALTERKPVELLPELWAAMRTVGAENLALHIGLVAACTQRQPALAVQAARSTPDEAGLARLLNLPATVGAFSAYQACEIIARVGRADHAEQLAGLARRFVGLDGFDMVAFACSRALRQWVGAEKAQRLMREQIGTQGGNGDGASKRR